jgi:hypothetical protein
MRIREERLVARWEHASAATDDRQDGHALHALQHCTDDDRRLAVMFRAAPAWA